ncbi:hypothetical protein BV372_13650 [Nostoc sp. T09]|uniref:hypothetical protein n=1 Tax=Nostoc sp. T09 TaxID=1932621 RepID=UPI000A37CD19|nr:hypothetical protein [Nostoc sp. T09]OUL34446.1 hypothetical protein BV372_13650 [Nostoc sp. T09]
MDTNNWLLDTLIYYRQIEFFTRYQDFSNKELVDEVKKLAKKLYSNTYERFFDEQNDWYVLNLDRQRVFDIDFGSIHDDCAIEGINQSIRQLVNVAEISRGFFTPNKVTSYYINECHGKIYSEKDLLNYFDSLPPDENIYHFYKNIVDFEIDGSRHLIVGSYDPSLTAFQINKIIINTGYQFYLGEFGDPTPMLLLNQEEAQKLEQERGLRANVIRRVGDTSWLNLPSNL